VSKVVFITGASSGIGRATALACAKAGFKVAGTGRRQAKLDQLVQEIQPLAGDFLALVGDVSNSDDMQEAVAQTLERFGRINVLVANAGVGHRGAWVDSEWDEMETLLRTNMDGVLHSIRACVPPMREAGQGHVIIISSVASTLVSPYAAIYAASKAFVHSISRSLRIELENDNIPVTEFIIGRTETEFNEKRLGEGARKPSSLPTMHPSEVADAIIANIERPRETVILPLFYRLIVLGNRLIPGIMGQLAKRQYR